MKFLKIIYQLVPFKPFLFKILKKIYIPPFYSALRIKKVIDVEYRPAKYFKLYCDYNLFMENELFWKGLYGGWEKKSLQIWSELCEHSNCILDVGANSGIYSLIAKAVNKNAKVFAFEPIQGNANLLKINNELNNFEIDINELAISDYNGVAKMYALPNTVNYITSVNKNRYAASKEVVETEVPTVTLASFIETRGLQNVDLIKIDVEEHEYSVLLGLGEYLRKYTPALLVEVIGNENAIKLTKLFEGLGYLYFLIDEVNEPKLVSTIVDKEHHNYLVCKAEIAQKIKLIK